ncbi:hypothetical protein H2248_000250 [Termitomyces sp. 'cryptogamus']|nr:hypothetical protein H2248_000250 [Termitomyces sp. 'cryptogamus']
MTLLNVAIIGGGPSGLTLANLLSNFPKTVNVTVFERDTSPASRTTKGGTLDLHADTGLAAIDAAGLRAAFNARSRADFSSSFFSIADRRGKLIFRHSDDAETGNLRPEIDREDLRDLLLDALPEGTIRWGAHVSSITSDGTLVIGASGVKESTMDKYDLVIGAEGAWSKVRAHLTDSHPVFSGIGGFEMHIINPDSQYPKISKRVGNGLYFTVGSGLALTGQRIGSGAIMIYLFQRMKGPSEPQELIDRCGSDLVRVQGELKKRYENAGWSAEFLEWINAADPKTIRAWPLYEYVLPDGHVFTHKPGWTVIGDAAHVMTPFAGEGVNAAMRDALELAKRVREVANLDGAGRAEALDKAVREYEEEMFKRSRRVMSETMRNKNAMYADNAPESIAEMFQELIGGGPSA